MTDQNTFMETLNAVKEIMRVAEEPLSQEEILAYFADLELEDNQKQLVLDFLSDSGNFEDTGDEVSDNSRIFQMYLEELEMLPMYTPEEKEEFYRKLLQGDSSMVDMISTAWLENVLRTARKYLDAKLSVEDLVQEGNMALLLKLQQLCGSMAKTDVEEELSTAVEEGIIAYVAGIRDERELGDAIVGRVSLVYEAMKLLTEETGHSPSTKELAEYTKIPAAELEELKNIIEEANR